MKSREGLDFANTPALQRRAHGEFDGARLKAEIAAECLDGELESLLWDCWIALKKG